MDIRQKLWPKHDPLITNLTRSGRHRLKIIAWPMAVCLTFSACAVHQPPRAEKDESEREEVVRHGVSGEEGSTSSEPKPTPAPAPQKPRTRVEALIAESDATCPPLSEEEQVLRASRELLHGLEAGEDPKNLADSVLAAGRKLKGAELRTMGEWARTQAELVRNGAALETMARHDAFRQAYVQRSRETTRLLGMVRRNLGTPGLLEETVGELVDALEPGEVQREGESSSSESVPEPLPFRTASKRAGRAATKDVSLGESIWGVITDLLEGVSTVTGPPTPADTSATPEIPLDEDMQALAATFGNDPVRIFEHVRNEFTYEPYYGSVKGARRTLREKAGNDIDLASATMALLRASGIPCRYVYGTIELSAERAAKLVGVDDPGQLAQVFRDFPNQIEFAGGSVAKIRIDHVWVKAYLDYLPYRGPVQDSGDTWIELDPGFKLCTYTSSRDIEAAVGLNPLGLLTEIKARSTADPAGSHVSGVPEEYILDELYSYAGPVTDYLASNEVTPETAFRYGTVLEERYGILPVTDYYPVVARGPVVSEMPSELRYSLKLAIVEADGTESLTVISTLPEVAGKRITLSYRPETAADAATIASYSDAEDFPVYLVSLVPEVRVAGAVAASGVPVGMGQSQDIAVTLVPPGGLPQTIRDRVVAGTYSAMVLDIQRIVAADLDVQKAALEATAEALKTGPGSADRESALGDVLHGIGLNYFQQMDRFNRITSGSLEVATTREPSLVRVTWDLTVQEQFGLPFTAKADRVTLNILKDAQAVVALGGTAAAAEGQFAFTAALTGSAVEHNALIQCLNEEAVSAVRVIQTANLRDQKIYTVTSANVGTVIPNLSLPQWALDDIQNAVSALQEVTVPEAEVVIHGVPYVGYIKRDIDTSASDFVLNGVSGGQQMNVSLRAADLVQPGDASRYLGPIEKTASWLNVADAASMGAGLVYLPTTTSINAWYENRAELDPVTTVAAAIAVSGPITRNTLSPSILNLEAGPGFISPNGDGVLDGFRLQADVTRDAAWTVGFYKNGSETPIHTVEGTDPRLDVTFDQEVADGGYRYRIAAGTDLADASPVTGTFKVDVTAPLTEITEPVAGATVQGAIEVRGTADDLNLDKFTVSVRGTKAYEATESQTDRVLCVLDTSAWTNGPADIVLEVTDKAGNVSTDAVSVTIGNPSPDHVSPSVAMTVTNPDGTPITPTSLPKGHIIVLGGSATDNVAVTELTLLVDDVAVASASDGGPVTCQLDTYLMSDGPHTFRATARDAAGNSSVSDTMVLTISSAISNLVVTPAVATLDDPMVTVSATLQLAADWTISFSGPSAIPAVSGTGTRAVAQFDARDYADGSYTATLTVAGVPDPAEAAFAIDVVDKAPIAVISEPADGLRIREGTFDLVGTADDDDPGDDVGYRVLLVDVDGTVVKDMTPGPVDEYGYHAGRVQDAKLGTLDFTTVRNGVYDVVLEVKGGFRIAQAVVMTVVDTQLKIGQFKFSHQDLVVPVSGIPLAVIRTYDSFNPTVGDFGRSWSYSIVDLEMEFDETRALTDGIFGTFSMRTGGGRNVTLTLPDGRRTTFVFRLGPPAAGDDFRYRAVWDAPPGVHATLEPTCSSAFVNLPMGMRYWEAAGLTTPVDAFDFPGFVLTTKDGTRYRVDREDLGAHDLFDGSFVQAYGDASLSRIGQRTGDRIEIETVSAVG
jgi:transglutaminase-like putative cysteine protease